MGGDKSALYAYPILSAITAFGIIPDLLLKSPPALPKSPTITEGNNNKNNNSDSNTSSSSSNTSKLGIKSQKINQNNEESITIERDSIDTSSNSNNTNGTVPLEEFETVMDDISSMRSNTLWGRLSRWINNHRDFLYFYSIVVLIGMYLLLYVGAETGYGGWIFTYAGMYN